MPLLPGVIIALLAAAGVGVINGFFTAIVGVNSFITTLGTLFAFEGLTLIISHAQPVATPGAQVTSTTVNVEHVVNGQHIVLPETVNHIGTFAKVFGGGTYSELIWALVIVRCPAGAAQPSPAGACTPWRSAPTGSARARRA